jgi:hypothetical protein
MSSNIGECSSRTATPSHRSGAPTADRIGAEFSPMPPVKPTRLYRQEQRCNRRFAAGIDAARRRALDPQWHRRRQLEPRSSSCRPCRLGQAGRFRYRAPCRVLVGVRPGQSLPCCRVQVRALKRASTISCRNPAAQAECRYSVDDVHDEVISVKIVKHHHVEGRGCRALRKRRCYSRAARRSGRHW